MSTVVFEYLNKSHFYQILKQLIINLLWREKRGSACKIDVLCAVPT